MPCVFRGSRLLSSHIFTVRLNNVMEKYLNRLMYGLWLLKSQNIWYTHNFRHLTNYSRVWFIYSLIYRYAYWTAKIGQGIYLKLPIVEDIFLYKKSLFLPLFIFSLVYPTTYMCRSSYFSYMCYTNVGALKCMLQMEFLRLNMVNQ